MGYGKRIDTLCSLLTPARSFADVGCDHGYCSEYALKNGLFETVIFSDISKGSLQKAERLLATYVREGKAKPVLGGGFYGVPKDVEEVLIAGMGGSEIIGILSDERYGFIPEKFVFQPMLNAEKLRKYLLENGAYIQRDFTFSIKNITTLSWVEKPSRTNGKRIRQWNWNSAKKTFCKNPKRLSGARKSNWNRYARI